MTEITVVRKEEVKIDEVLKDSEIKKCPIDEMPLDTLRDYRLYNEAARKENKRLGMCRYAAKPCPIELHPKQRIIFGRNDQPSNPLKVYLSNSNIHFEETLIPGKAYDLPECVVHYLGEKGNPVWKWRDLPDGGKETFMSHKEPRFALRTVYQGDY